MATNTIIEIAVAAVAIIAILIVVGLVARRKRAEHRHVQAGEIREDAAAKEHQVGRREALAEETAAHARVAAAEADAQSAHATGLAHQAAERRSSAVTARGEVNDQLQRADTLDPQTPDEHTERQDRAASHRGPATRPRG
jgi:FtsZ-interacting cell division protein ZipA